jgi:hypothetical protein
MYLIERVIKMGMTDNQFKAYRQRQLSEFEDMLAISRAECSPGSILIKKLEKQIVEAKADIER